MALLEKNEVVTLMTEDMTRAERMKYSCSYFIRLPEGIDRDTSLL